MGGAGSENRAANTAAFVVKGLIDKAFEMAYLYSIAQLPFLKWPVVSQIYKLLLKNIQKAIDEQLVDLSAFIIIDVQQAHQRDAYLDSVEELRTAIKSGDSNAIALAAQKARKNMATLIHWNESHPR